MTTKTTLRETLAAKILDGCPDNMVGHLADHQAIAAMLLGGTPAWDILNSRECDNWPETYSWLHAELMDEL